MYVMNPVSQYRFGQKNLFTNIMQITMCIAKEHTCISHIENEELLNTIIKELNASCIKY